MMRPKLSISFLIWNGIERGYPFWESLDSMIDIADEVVVLDGGSTDGTLEALEAYRRLHPDKVRLEHKAWDIEVKSTPLGEIIGRMTHDCMARCSGEWIYNLQADEIMPAQNLRTIHDLARYNVRGLGSLEIGFDHYTEGWVAKPHWYRTAVRMVANNHRWAVESDGWNLRGDIGVTMPSTELPRRLIHLESVFSYNALRKRVSHARLYPQHGGFQVNAQRAREKLELVDVEPYAPPPNPLQFPHDIRRFFGQSRYIVPPVALQEIERAEQEGNPRC